MIRRVAPRWAERAAKASHRGTSWRKLCVPAVGDSKQTEPSSSASQSPDSAPTASFLDEVKDPATFD